MTFTSFFVSGLVLSNSTHAFFLSISSFPVKKFNLDNGTIPDMDFIVLEPLRDP
jgi:hypothetical protein